MVDTGPPVVHPRVVRQGVLTRSSHVVPIQFNRGPTPAARSAGSPRAPLHGAARRRPPVPFRDRLPSHRRRGFSRRARRAAGDFSRHGVQEPRDLGRMRDGAEVDVLGRFVPVRWPDRSPPSHPMQPMRGGARRPGEPPAGVGGGPHGLSRLSGHGIPARIHRGLRHLRVGNSRPASTGDIPASDVRQATHGPPDPAPNAAAGAVPRRTSSPGSAPRSASSSSERR